MYPLALIYVGFTVSVTISTVEYRAERFLGQWLAIWQPTADQKACRLYVQDSIVSKKKPIHNEALNWFPIGHNHILGIRQEVADN